ncbi:rod-binding protein [Parasulfitobacter algicola]|uniref:Rod-binding protein n=1 Tax=Parasulfitobacter algicola TaxID=2614809 RepID=A0ABX2IUH7_9RHOB|nr:rod-binding protein [Sulfitobacter algicola]NSX56564.1 rod-binding protein [Sulfitobacter algicola]
MADILSIGGVQSNPFNKNQKDAHLKKTAQSLEATFLAEMLKSAGVGKSAPGFNGGAGEDQFASFLRQAQADEMVKAGGIGLSEAIFENLKQRVSNEK